MSDEVSESPVADDDPLEPVRGKRIAEELDEPESGSPMDAPALPSRVADVIAEAVPRAQEDVPTPSPQPQSRRAAWAEKRVEKLAAREAEQRHAQDEAAEAARQRAIEEERAILAAKHRAAGYEDVDPDLERRERAAAEAEAIRRQSEADEAERRRLDEELEAERRAAEEAVRREAEAEADAAHRAAEAEAARRAAEAEELRRLAETPPEPQDLSLDGGEPTVAQDPDFASRWAEAEAAILQAQEDQRIRAERAVAAVAATTPVEGGAEPAAEQTPEPALPEVEPQPEFGTEPESESEAEYVVDEPAEESTSGRRVAERSERRRKDPDAPPALGSLRSKLASLVWLVAVLAALVLAVGALCVALELSRDNAIVDLILDSAAAIDFGVFREFSGDDAATRSALVNWGIAAVIWLVVGKVLDKLIRP